MYLSWAVYYEGRTDALYFNILIPRFLERILREEGVRPYDVGLSPAVQLGIGDRAFDGAAKLICARQEEFHIIIIHADAGGRGQNEAIEMRREALIDLAREECDFDGGVAAYLSPRKESEAWAIADHGAVMAAFGLSRIPEGVLPQTPAQAERVEDPKAVLRQVSQIAGRKLRDNHGILARISQEHDVDLLRGIPSFIIFEDDVRAALRHIGCF